MRPILVLRPEPGATATARRAERLGLEARCHPLFEIKPLPWAMPEGRFDGLLLTSANAIRHGGALPGLPVHAVGEATAAAAHEAGLEVATVGHGGITALLSMMPAELRLLHLGGVERLLPEAVRQFIVSVDVYEAVPLPLPNASLVEGAVLLVHSPAAGRRVADLQCDRKRVRLAAISPAAAAACGSGWDRTLAAPVPSDAALLPLAAELCKD